MHYVSVKKKKRKHSNYKRDFQQESIQSVLLDESNMMRQKDGDLCDSSGLKIA